MAAILGLLTELSASVRCVCQSPPTLPLRLPAWATWRSFTVLLPPLLPLHLHLFLPLAVCLSPACFPSGIRQPLNPWSNHRFFGYRFVILKASGFCNRVLHKHFSRPDIHVFLCLPTVSVCFTTPIISLLLFTFLSLPSSCAHSPFISHSDSWQGLSLQLTGKSDACHNCQYCFRVVPNWITPEHLIFLADQGHTIFFERLEKTLKILQLVPLQQPFGYGSSLKPHPVKPPN